MPSGIENLEGNRFIIRYEQPWGGIATNVQPEDIAPNTMQSTQGAFIRHGVLASTTHYNFTTADFLHSTDGVNPYVNLMAQGFKAIYTCGDFLVGIDSGVNGWIYDFADMKWIPDHSLSSGPGGPVYTCSQMIEGIIYIFDYWNAYEYVYKPNISMEVAKQIDGSDQNFVAGKYCMTVDRYLITCNVTQPNDTPNRQPGRYSWSGPSKYTTFDPNIDPAANEGWNNLAEVQKEITGCFAMSNVGYIIHDQGLTQLTPTGNGILPFDATALWTSKDGVGCTLPDTLAVFGYLAIWGNNNDFYMFSAGAVPQPICGVARRAIYKDITRFKYPDSRYFAIRGQFINCGVTNRSPVMVYNLYLLYQTPLPVADTSPGGDIILITWSYILETNSWTRSETNLSDVISSLTGDPNSSLQLLDSGISTMRFPTTSGALAGEDFRLQSPLYGGVLLSVGNESGTGGFGYGFFFFQYINSEGDVPAYFPAPNTSLIFRAEEFQLDRTPTIRGIILRAAGTGMLQPIINGVNFSPIIVNSPLKTKRYRSYGVVTDPDEAATLSITSVDFNGYISKVHVFGTYAEGEPI